MHHGTRGHVSNSIGGESDPSAESRIHWQAVTAGGATPPLSLFFRRTVKDHPESRKEASMLSNIDQDVTEDMPGCVWLTRLRRVVAWNCLLLRLHSIS